MKTVPGTWSNISFDYFGTAVLVTGGADGISKVTACAYKEAAEHGGRHN